MGVLVSAWFSFSCEDSVFDEIYQRMGYGGAVVVEASSCHLSVDFA